jgi:hypothetical protein
VNIASSLTGDGAFSRFGGTVLRARDGDAGIRQSGPQGITPMPSRVLLILLASVASVLLAVVALAADPVVCVLLLAVFALVVATLLVTIAVLRATEDTDEDGPAE